MKGNKIDELLRPLTCLLKVFGLTPLSHTRTSVSFLYTILVLSVYIAIFILSLLSLESQPVEFLAQLIRYLVSALSVMFVVVSMVQGQWNKGLILEVTRELYELGERNIKGNNTHIQLYHPNYNGLKTEIQKFCFTFIFIAFISYETLHNLLQGLNSFKTVNFLVPNFCSLLMAIHFYLLLNFVQKRLESMHRYFMSFNQLDSLLISDTQRSVNRLFSTMLVRAELICSLKTFYKIFHVCEGINTIFSVQILIALILVHVLLTCIMYVMTETVVNYLSGKQPLDHYIMYTNVYWFAFYWVMIGLLVVPCENIVTLKMKILETVHQIIIEDKMPELTLELEMFLMDLQNYKIQFTAHGFLSLQYSLFRKIIGAVFTYWILLIQFH